MVSLLEVAAEVVAADLVSLLDQPLRDDRVGDARRLRSFGLYLGQDVVGEPTSKALSLLACSCKLSQAAGHE